MPFHAINVNSILATRSDQLHLFQRLNNLPLICRGVWGALFAPHGFS